MPETKAGRKPHPLAVHFVRLEKSGDVKCDQARCRYCSKLFAWFGKNFVNHASNDVCAGVRHFFLVLHRNQVLTHCCSSPRVSAFFRPAQSQHALVPTVTTGVTMTTMRFAEEALFNRLNGKRRPRRPRWVYDVGRTRRHSPRLRSCKHCWPVQYTAVLSLLQYLKRKTFRYFFKNVGQHFLCLRHTNLAGAYLMRNIRLCSKKLSGL